MSDLREYEEAYRAGIVEGRRLEREEWMAKIGDVVIDALREATVPEDYM